jgi:hypothetical protein
MPKNGILFSDIAIDNFIQKISVCDTGQSITGRKLSRLSGDEKFSYDIHQSKAIISF